MTYTVTPLTKIDFAPQTVIAEVLQNVRCIIATFKGTVPLDRAFGIDFDGIDTPMPQAQMLFRVALIDAIEQYEPRAQVKKIEFSQNDPAAADGQLIPVVTLEINTDA